MKNTKGREALNKLIDLETTDKGITLSYGGRKIDEKLEKLIPNDRLLMLGGRIKEKEIAKHFDKIRENIANEIGMPKETLFPLIYGNEKMKKEYVDFVRKLVEKYEKRPKE